MVHYPVPRLVSESKTVKLNQVWTKYRIKNFKWLKLTMKYGQRHGAWIQHDNDTGSWQILNM